MFHYAAVALGGALGSVSRYALVLLTQFFTGSRFPWGTFVVNGLGSFLIGFFMTIFMERFLSTESFRLFVIVGFMGGFTTFSSLTWETWALYLNGQWTWALVNILLNNVCGLVLLICGIRMASYL